VAAGGGDIVTVVGSTDPAAERVGGACMDLRGASVGSAGCIIAVVARTTTRAQRRPLALLLGGLVIVAGVWLAGGLAAAAGWSLAWRWFAAGLVWPLVPLALLIFINPRLGLRRVAVALTLLGTGACALWWRAGLVEAATTHAMWMLSATARESAAPAPGPAREPSRPSLPVAPDREVVPGKPGESPGGGQQVADSPSPQAAGVAPVVAAGVAPVVRDGKGEPRSGSRCFRDVIKNARSDSAYGTTLVDLDGDAILDAVAIVPGESPEIRVWKGDRAGRFDATSTIAYDGGGLQLAILDGNGDGKLDVATSDYSAATVTLWLGAGDGSLRRGASQKTYRSPIGIVAADLDLDGFSDLVVSHYFHVEVMRGGKGGKLRTAPWLRLVKEPGAPDRLLTPEDILATDLTGDGLLDLVIPKGDVTSIEVWIGRGRGEFRRSAAVASCYAPAHTLVGDVIEDGSVDIAVRCGAARFELFAGDGTGGLESRGPIGPENAFGAGALVDLTGDGHLDLISTTLPGGIGSRGFDTRSGVLVVHAGDGKGGFREEDALTLDGLQHRVTAVVDIDGDEHLDIVYECFAQSPGAHLGVAFGTGCGARE
jgi:hypothetical protein